MNYQTVLQNYHPTEQGDFMLRYEIVPTVTARFIEINL